MLPVSYPKFDLILPSNGKKIVFRPFLMREEKLLLFAAESNVESEVVAAIDNVVKECTFGAVSNDTHPFFDIQYVFLQIRAKSVGEVAEFMLVCGHCENKIDSNLDLEGIKLIMNKDHTDKISLSKDTGIIMGYPKLEHLALVSTMDSVESVYDVVVSCMKTVYHGDEVFDCASLEKEELVEFLDGLTSVQFQKIQQFFETMPHLQEEIEYTCSKCEKQNIVGLDGILNFFG